MNGDKKITKELSKDYIFIRPENIDRYHYNRWKEYYEKDIDTIYNYFYYYFKDLYQLNKDSKELFNIFLYKKSI